MGWSGINVNATSGSMVLFKLWRFRDINLEFAVAREKQLLKFFMFNDPALNSFDENLSRLRNSDPYYILRE